MNLLGSIRARRAIEALGLPKAELGVAGVAGRAHSGPADVADRARCAFIAGLKPRGRGIFARVAFPAGALPVLRLVRAGCAIAADDGASLDAELTHVAFFTFLEP